MVRIPGVSRGLQIARQGYEVARRTATNIRIGLSNVIAPPLNHANIARIDPLAHPIVHQIEAIGPQIENLIAENGRLNAENVRLRAENARLESESKEKDYDGLTGLMERKPGEKKLAEEIDRASRYGRPLSFLMMDIDHFKEVNDTYGHPEGDKVLAAVAATIRNALRTTDIPFRYGGEEFSAVLTETDTPNAFTVAERIRVAISGLAFKFDNQDVRVTISIGVTTFDPRRHSEPASIIKEADKAAYEAKHKGRNRVELAAELKAA